MLSENTFVDFESDTSDSSWEDVEEEDAADETVCHALLMNSLILEKIFYFLPTKDLLECRRVCKEWNKTTLLRNVLGSKFKITVSKANFDRLLKTAQNSPSPFCRKFEFHLLELEYEKVSKFIQLFGERVNRLTIKFCTASSPESVIKILSCPRLEELRIYGALPIFDENSFNAFNFSRLKVISLNSSLDYGQVSKVFIQMLLKHAPNLCTVQIGQSISLWKDFCGVGCSVTESKLCHVGLSGIEDPLEIDHFRDFRKPLILEKIHFQNCIVRLEFLEQLLLQISKNLTTLTVDGTQQEILSTVFRNITLPNLKEITLPLDGFSVSDGCYLLESCPKLEKLEVIGLFNSYFLFEDGKLISVTMKEKFFSTLFSRDSLQQTVRQEKRREFFKIISLLPLQPLRLEISLTSLSQINSRCLREVYISYPDLENLVLLNDSYKDCLVGLTGIPYRLCKRMAYCRSYSVLHSQQTRLLASIASLKKLKRLEITILGDIPSADVALIFIAYGICELENLEELILNNFKVPDVALIILAQKLKLSICKINGSEDRWKQLQSIFRKHTIKSFLLPPKLDSDIPLTPAQVVGTDSRLLKNVLCNLDHEDIYDARKVCSYWHSFISNYLHETCSSGEYLISNLEKRLDCFEKDNSCPPSPGYRVAHYLGETTKEIMAFPKILQIWSSFTKETTVAIVSLGKSSLESFQRSNQQISRKSASNCQKRRQLEYWYYPDGSDNLIYCERVIKSIDTFTQELKNIDALLVIGCWGRKDNGLMEFLNPSWSVSTLHLIGLQKEALDIVLPKITLMINLESLIIRPLVNGSPYCDVTKTHLQILSNSSFKLRKLNMQLHATSDTVVEFVRSQRFTLETLELRSNVNISDRLTFSMPQLKLLQLDEPPGSLLWTTLNVHAGLETINFGRNCGSYSQVKIKSSPKMDPLDADFKHEATEIVCDINWFLENVASRKPGSQKSILQHGSDSALKFFMHFPYLTSLTLKSVHAHYKILQGIFKHFTQLKKLILINATGVSDEVLTGFSKEILDELDIMNPFQVKNECYKATAQGKNTPSIRNLKSLTHLSLDDQPLCTDLAIIFGILKLYQLEHFSCRKWKITDVALRAISDTLPCLKHVNIDGCDTVSHHALNYFNERRARHHQLKESSYN